MKNCFLRPVSASRSCLLAAALTLAVSCGSSGGGHYTLGASPGVLELPVTTGSKAFVDIVMTPGEGFEGTVQLGLLDTDVEALPGGILPLAVCPSSEIVTGCDSIIDTVVDTSSGDLAGILGFEVTSGTTLVPGSEYTMTVVGELAGTGGNRQTATFILLLTGD